MNILFLLKTCEIGGIGIVTSVLANQFVSKGYKVTVVSFLEPPTKMLKKFHHGIKTISLGKYVYNKDNIKKLRDVLISENIDIIINQLGLPFMPIRVINKAKMGLNIKVISVYHNQINTNGKIMAVDQAIMLCNDSVKIFALKIKRFAVKFVTSYSMKYVYKHSDVYEVLSPSFVDLFKKFTGIENPNKLVVQTNPITIDNESWSFSQKQKEVIYVGRLDFVQKRVYRVIDTWNYLEQFFPDWKLTIVGDGDDRQNLENQVKNLKLKNVIFTGFQDPIKYYKRASILLLTSDFKGFPLVLPECMNFGVIPVVYNSYSAVGDIIDNGKNGIIIPYNKKGYQAEVSAKMLASIMNDSVKQKEMALSAIEKSRKFSIEKICGEWESIFEKLCMS